MTVLEKLKVKPLSGVDKKAGARRWARPALIAVSVVAVAAAAGYFLRPHGLPPGIVSGNGRLEATEVDVAAKIPGRIRDVLVDEGDYVRAGQVVAHIDTENLQAQRAEAVAQLAAAQNDVKVAETEVGQRQSERAAAAAKVIQRQSELGAARLHFKRSDTLSKEGATPLQERDDDQARVASFQAATESAQADVAAADAALATARKKVITSRSQVDADQAKIQRIDSDIRDSDLKAGREGRVQFRVAQPGEVMGSGGRVLNLVDLTDVYMTFFLPEREAGQVRLGSDARLTFDAAPGVVVPAKVDFVADVAQFTPKTVETKVERQKLMFRVKARIAPELLRQHLRMVKTGMPGLAYVRADPNAQFPDYLKVRLP
jgi:HlyD family secretion protein